MENGFSHIEINYDYEGIEKWYTGEWSTKKDCTANYAQFMHNMVRKYNLYLVFNKVKSHSGNKYNELADSLAKQALNMPRIQIEGE